MNTKLWNLCNLLSVKIETCLKSCIGNGTFELRYRTAADTVAKRQNTRALQQRIEPKRVISQTLQVELATVNRDISYCSKSNIKKYID
jgi:hypothetical protein